MLQSAPAQQHCHAPPAPRPLLVNPYATREDSSCQTSTAITPPPPYATRQTAQPPLSNNSSTLDDIFLSLDNTNAKTLLQQSAGLSAEELLFATNSKRGKNQKSYQDSQESVGRRFFDTLELYGGNVLKPLLRKVTLDFGQGPVEDYAFYKLLQGDKSPKKHKLLAYAMMLPAMKWTCLSGKRKGEPLEPNSFDKTIQKLFYTFQRKGIKYHYKQDFNEPGGFHGLVIDRWNSIRQQDPKFGTHRNKSVIVNNYLDLIIKALKEGTLQPHNNPEHLLMLVIFINGYYVGLRGSQEHVQLMLGDIVRDAQYTLEHGPELAGLHYCGVQVPFHKMKQLKLGSTTMSSDQEQVFTIAEDPNNDVFCPWKIYQLYLSRCHPNATKFYAKPFTPKQREDWKAEHGTDVWYMAASPGCSNYNLGHVKLASYHKRLAQMCGVDNWEKVTGHALRTLIINTMKLAGSNPMEIANAVRQKSLNAQMTYNRNMVGSEANKAAALRPQAGRKRVVAPPLSPPHRSQPSVAARAPSAPTSKERMQSEIDSLKLAIASQNQVPITHHPQNFGGGGFNPMMGGMANGMVPHGMTGMIGMGGTPMMNPAAAMMNPFMSMQAQQAAMFGNGMMAPFHAHQMGNVGGFVPMQQHQPSHASFHHHGGGSTLSVQNPNAYRTQPPFETVHTGHPTQQMAFDQQQQDPTHNNDYQMWLSQRYGR